MVGRRTLHLRTPQFEHCNHAFFVLDCSVSACDIMSQLVLNEICEPNRLTAFYIKLNNIT